MHLKVSFTNKRAKNVQNVQKRASQMFLEPIQKRALSRSVHLEAVYLEALLYHFMEISNWKEKKEVGTSCFELMIPMKKIKIFMEFFYVSFQK